MKYNLLDCWQHVATQLMLMRVGQNIFWKTRQILNSKQDTYQV